MKNALKQFMTDANSLPLTNMRGRALVALEKISTIDDVAFFQHIAESDPVEVVRVGGMFVQKVDGAYINVPDMERIPGPDDPAWKYARRRHPMREMAEAVVKRIRE